MEKEKRCVDCGFKFKTDRGQTKRCKVCRLAKADKWRRDQDKSKPTPKSGKIQGF